jgi:hypothetical protein
VDVEEDSSEEDSEGVGVGEAALLVAVAVAVVVGTEGGLTGAEEEAGIASLVDCTDRGLAGLEREALEGVAAAARAGEEAVLEEVAAVAAVAVDVVAGAVTAVLVDCTGEVAGAASEDLAAAGEAAGLVAALSLRMTDIGLEGARGVIARSRIARTASYSSSTQS